MTRWLPILVLWTWGTAYFDDRDLVYRFENPRIEYHYRFIQDTESECKEWGKREAQEAMATRYRVECKPMEFGNGNF